MTLERRTPMKRSPLKRGDSQLKRTRIKPVSKKRAALNRERAVVVAEIATIRPMCAWPECKRLGEHPHEIWTRGRSGSDPHALLCKRNIVMVCPPHHDEITFGDEELARSYGLIRRSHEGCPCGYPKNQPRPHVKGRVERIEE